MAKRKAVCGRCGGGQPLPAPIVFKYGRVCASCLKACAFPVDPVAKWLAPLVTGELKLPLGFTSYREIQERREAQDKAIRLASLREAEERAALLRARANRSSRAGRAALIGRLRAAEFEANRLRGGANG